MNTTKPLSNRQKANIVGISPNHYWEVAHGKTQPSLEVAMAMAPLEGRHFLNIMRPSLFDQQGNQRAEPENQPAQAS